MTDVVSTIVASFGEAVQSASGSIVVEWDDTLNVNDDGSEKTQFVPGDTAFLLVHADQGVDIVAVKATAGNISNQGGIVLSREQELGFADAADIQTLNYRPASSLALTWYGRQGSGKSVSGKELSFAAGFPCLARAVYSVAFQRYALETPSMSLDSGTEFPIRVYVYYTEATT